MYKRQQFTLETEINIKLNFLDLTITRLDEKFQYQIYRKPTTTDLTINAESHHPFSQKMAAYHSLIHRLLSIPLEDKDFLEELNTIKYIAKANGYKRSIVDNLVKKHRKKKNNIELQENNRNKIRYIASEYGNTLPKILNKVFGGINIKMAHRTNNNINKILLPKHSKSIEDRSGVYKIICLSLIHI